MTDQAIDPVEIPENTAADTTMEGDYSPAEAEGLKEYQEMIAAMERGEDFPEGDGVTTKGDAVEDADVQDADDPEQKPEADVPRADPVEAKQEEQPPADADIEAALTERAEIVATLEESLAEAEARAIAIGDQLENGEITQAKYEIEFRKALREVEAIEGRLAGAQAALGEVEATAENAKVASDPWYQAATSFLGDNSNEIFNAGEHHEGLKQAISFARSLPHNANKSPAEIINAAATAYRQMAGLEAPAAKPAAPKAKAAPNIPPTLGQMQAALPNTDESPFAYLSKLSGEAYEAAYAKLSPDQRATYLESLG